MTQRFRYYLRVRYQDCDAQKVVFNARYGDYFDVACIEFLRAALPNPQDAMDGTFEIQSVRQVTEWKASARFDDVLEISMWTSRIGTTSFTLSAEIRRAGTADVLADHRDHLRARRPCHLHQARHRAAHARRARSRRGGHNRRSRRLLAVVPSPHLFMGRGLG